MAKDQIILEYQLTQKGGDKVVSTVNDITEAWQESEKAATAALSEKQIDNATVKLEKFNNEVEKTASGFTSAKAELGNLTKQITSGALQGKDLQVAIKRAAELKDRIADVKEEIGRLSSDTRLFDTFVEGGRAVAAAFSIAQGAAALFGEENKDLQKSILKVQGALALLTGAQELANIVTKQGGIATQAYGFALKAVDGIAKVTGLSIAASMAVATAGVTILAAGVIALISYFNSADDAAEELAANEAQRERQREISDATQKAREKEQANSFERRRLLAKDEKELAQVNIKIIKEQIDAEKQKQLVLSQTLSAFKETEQATKEYQSIYGVFLDSEKRELDLIKDLNKEKKTLSDINFRLAQAANKPIENLDVKRLTLTPQEIKVEEPKKVPELEIKVNLKPEPVLTEEEKKQLQEAYFEFASSAASSLQSISSSIFGRETAALEEEKQKQLKLAGDNAKQREAIEKRFAIRSAELRRKQAISDKAFALANIGINTASAIQKQLSVTPLPAGAAFVALIAASAALQTAAVLAQPLPEIPKFKKGVIGFKGKGTETSDENLVFISNNESVMTGKATSKYREELQAAQDLQLEDLIYQKYLLPALKQAGAADKEGNLYDDWLLRKEVKANRQAERENSKFIVNGILSGMRGNSYLTQRYYS